MTRQLLFWTIFLTLTAVAVHAQDYNKLLGKWKNDMQAKDTLAYFEFIEFSPDSFLITKFSHVNSTDPLKPYIYKGDWLYIGDFEFKIIELSDSKLTIEMTDKMYNRISKKKKWFRKNQTLLKGNT